MNEILLVHPEPMPCIRNRAVFQRPLWFAQHFRLTILTMHGVGICEEIVRESKIIPLSYFSGRLGKLIWKCSVSLWLVRYSLLHPFNYRKVVVYAFPQWGWLPLVVAKMVGYKVIVDMQHTPLYYTDYAYINDLKWKAKAYYMTLGAAMSLAAKLILRRLDLVVSMSHADNTGFSKLFQESFGVQSSRIFSIPNGIELADAPPQLPKAEAGTINIIYAGNIQFAKVASIIGVLQALVEGGLDIEFHIAGKVSRSYQERFNSLLQKHERFVRYHGHLSHANLIALYMRCDYGLFMVDKRVFDHNNSHPGKIFEYMLYGCLPIASRIESLNYVIQSGRNGVLFDNVNELQETLKALIADPEMSNRMRAEAYSSLNMFDWDKLNQRLQLRIQKLIAE